MSRSPKSTASLPLLAEKTKRKLDDLFASAKVFVEVICPGTSSDYYLLEEREEFDALMAELPPGTHVWLTKAIDIRSNQKGFLVSK
jgi:hypothetical protein